MKLRLALLTLITLSGIFTTAQSKAVTKVVADLAFKSLGKPTTAEVNGFPSEYSYVWETTIAETEKQDVKIDFNTLNFFVGDKTDSQTWGITCDPAKGCKPSNPSVTFNYPALLGRGAVTGVTGEVNLTLTGTTNATAATNLVQTGNPFNGVNSIGLGPGGNFWKWLQTAGALEDNVNIQFSINGGTLAENLNNTSGKLKAAITLASSDPANAITANPINPTGVSYYASWAFKGATLTAPYKNTTFNPFAPANAPPAPEGDTVTLIQEGDLICINPDVEEVMTLNVPLQTIQQFQTSFYANVCSGAKNKNDLLTKCTNGNNAPKLTFKVDKATYTITPNDYVYNVKTGSDTRATAAIGFTSGNTGIFAAGNVCEGAKAVLGRNFFTKYGLTLSVDKTLTKYSIGISAPGGGFGWLVWVLVIGAVLIIVGVIVMFVCNKGGDGDLDEPLNDYAK